MCSWNGRRGHRSKAQAQWRRWDPRGEAGTRTSTLRNSVRKFIGTGCRPTEMVSRRSARAASSSRRVLRLLSTSLRFVLRERLAFWRRDADEVFGLFSFCQRQSKRIHSGNESCRSSSTPRNAARGFIPRRAFDSGGRTSGTSREAARLHLQSEILGRLRALARLTIQSPAVVSAPKETGPLLRVCSLLNAAGANYLVAGAYAMILNSVIRATEDVDILIFTGRFDSQQADTPGSGPGGCGEAGAFALNLSRLAGIRAASGSPTSWAMLR